MGEDTILEILDTFNAKGRPLMPVLEEIQARYSYLPEEALRLVAEETGIPLADVYAVATFYKSFSLKPRGKHLVCACLGTACHVRGAPAVTQELERQLDIRAGETTPDKEFTLETVNCLGACALGPVVLADGRYFSKVKTREVRKLLDEVKSGGEQIDLADDRRIFPIDVSCPRCNHRLMDPGHLLDGCPSIAVTISFGSKHGWLRLSSLYGSYSVQSEHEVPEDRVVDFFCPHCHTELVGTWECSSCEAPMVPMFVRGGGVIQICSRRGCRNHLLELV